MEKINWTDEQKKVIDSRKGNLLVAAAAGSGKTAVLVERIIEMVMGIDSEGNKISDGVDIDELLVVTFTKAAAAQMKEKIGAEIVKMAEEKMYDEHLIKQLALIPRAEIMTIDSFCLSVVKEHFNVVGLDSGFSIADTPEMELIKADVLDEIMEEAYMEGDSSFIRLIESFSRKESDANIADMVEKIYKLSSSFPRPDVWLDSAKSALCISNATQLGELGWYRDYEKNVKRIIQSSIISAKYCLDICCGIDGPIGYAASIEADIDMFELMAGKESLSEIKSVYTGFVNIGRNKKDSCDEKLAEIVKSERKKYKEMIEKVVLAIIPEEMILAETHMMGKPLIALINLVKRYRERLGEVKREKNLYEFHDIEEFALQIVCEGYDEDGCVIASDTGRAISRKYREILVDEYQDSNFLQEDILCCVSGYGMGINNIFMVGDIKQSIYRFRMARPDLFLNKYNTYSEEENSDTQKIILSNNFRSSKPIINCVNSIFAMLMSEDIGGIEYNEDSFLKPGTVQKSDMEYTKPELYVIGNDTKDTEDGIANTEIEAMYIAQKIKKIVEGDEPIYIYDDKAADGKRRVTYKDIVILLRSVKSSSEIYDRIFSEHRIPVYLESEQGYFDAVEVKTLLSMLAIVDNAYLDYEMAAVLRSPIVGLDEEQMAYIVGTYDTAMKEEKNGNALKNGMLYDKIVHYVNLKKDDEISIRLVSFLDMLSFLKSEKNYMSISDMLRYILDETGYYWYVAAMGMGKRRQANIDMLISKADAYESSTFKGLFNFLRYVSRLKINDIDFAEASALSENEDVVRIMTMHKSKGLEFPVVFVSGLGKTFANMDARDSVIVHPDYYLASYAIDTEKRVKQNTFARKSMSVSLKTEMYAEEMRVLYVALTRAKQKLYITGCVEDSEKFINKCRGVVRCTEDMEGNVSDKDRRLLYSDKLAAASFLEWILMSIFSYGNMDEAGNELDIYELNGSDILSGNDTGIYTLHIENKMSESEEKLLYDDTLKKLNMTYIYGNEKYRSKMSITEIKRLLSQGEENPGEDVYNLDRRGESAGEVPVPEFMKKKRQIRGNELGTVMHKIMELIDFEKNTYNDVCMQVDIMFENAVFDECFRNHINCDKILSMLNSNVGRRMAEAAKKGKLYKEQQFYIGMKPGDICNNSDVLVSADDATNIKDIMSIGNTSHAQATRKTDDIIVVQGIIDAYFIEDNEAIILDYKTDYVQSMEELKLKYHVQLDKYADTVTRLTGYKVKEKIIYSFCLNDEISF